MSRRNLIILAVVLALVAAGSYFLFFRSRGPSPAATQRQAVAVERGTILVPVSATGNVFFDTDAKLTFENSGTVKEVKVALGEQVKKGQILARLDTETLERSLAQAKADLEIAQLNLEATLNLYDDSDRATAQASLLDAQNALNTAARNLSNARIDAETALSTAQTNLENAKRDLIIDQATYDSAARTAHVALLDAQETYRLYVIKYLAGFTQAEDERQLTLRDNAQDAYNKAVQNRDKVVATDKNNIATAEATLKKAQQDLAELKAEISLPTINTGPGSLEQTVKDLNQINTALASSPQKLSRYQLAEYAARAAVVKARANLDDVLAGAKPRDIELKRQSLAKSQLALDTARSNLVKATIVAPFNGIISSVAVKEGDTVSGNTVAITLANPATAKVRATLDELDVARAALGQEVSIALDALPGVNLKGKVSTLAPVAQVQSGVVTYQVDIELASTNASLKGGMTALTTIYVEKKESVLVVPSRAIKLSGRSRYVEIQLSDGATEQRTITVGANDDLRTEILSGLKEGERILMDVPAGTGTGARPSGGATPGATPAGGARPPGGALPGGAQPPGR
ncbi:MAG: efflux RND transporter periplasmic adaptor subunit [Chloroflexi bacterium]|nr:efflux RND transporter periplasmic adaptor subunit [Chloroflexota bacterium]